MSQPTQDLTAELAKALGLPKGTTRAVLTLEAGRQPILEITSLVFNHMDEVVVEQSTDLPARIASVHFMLRLQRFEDAP